MIHRIHAVRYVAILAGLGVASAVLAETAPNTDRAPILNEISHLALTSDAFFRFEKAEANLAVVGESDPTLIAVIAVHPSDEARADWIRRIETNPKAAEAIRSAGLSPKEYLMMAGAVVQAYTVSARKKAGKPLPTELDGKIPQQNIEFVESHLAQVEAWQKDHGKRGGKPNTMEDIYTAPPVPAPETAQKPDKPKKP